ncbi:MAG: DNA-3-methyladenine glycosylase 2 [Holophaga sp.]|nr:DNA-3-methyladenine glycosylase 2 [Holophaga sp.]
MHLDPEGSYQALISRDARFDGRFFVGVTSTGIYCRPICRVRRPKQENCTFHANAAAAEASGFRPCLRCRPELAPGNAPMDASVLLAHRIAMALQAGIGLDDGLEALAVRFGVSERHVRRVFCIEYGVSPVEFLQTQRLLTAKRLLTDTGMPMSEVAWASGFSSLRRFNALFQERYRLKPSDLRKQGPRLETAEGFRFCLPFRPPYDAARLLGFLGLRAIPGMETFDGSTYRRTIAVQARGNRFQGWLSVRLLSNSNSLEAVLSPSLGPVIPLVLTRLAHLLDLGGHPEVIEARLGSLAEARPGLRVPGVMDGFELAVRAVLGQQVTVKAARTMAQRVLETFGDPVATPFEALRWTFPSPERLAMVLPEELGALGILRTRSATIKALARAIADKELRLEPGVDVDSTLKALLSLPGIGDWTAHYIAMRALAWPDAFVATDYGVRTALPGLSTKEIKARAEAWRPWRAYAVMHLWASLEN